MVSSHALVSCRSCRVIGMAGTTMSMSTMAQPRCWSSCAPPLSSCSRLSPAIPARAACCRRMSTAPANPVRAQYKPDGSGNQESKAVLDAFFLGKALAEAVTERVGSALGEFLSDVGRRQAEQQKTIREFQEEVQDRARKAMVKAAIEAARGSNAPAAYTPSSTSEVQEDAPKDSSP